MRDFYAWMLLATMLAVLWLHFESERLGHLLIDEIRKVEQSVDQLKERIRAIEEFENPKFRRRLQYAAPLPLQRVYFLKFWLHPSFWESLSLSPAELEYEFAHADLPSAIVIEAWRSQVVVSIEKWTRSSELN